MSTKNPGISRRAALTGAAGLALYATLAKVANARAQRSFTPSFETEIDALRAHIKLVGSLATEQVISFYRLNIYADLHEGNYVPMFTMNNLLVDNWTAMGDDKHLMMKFEAGYFTAIDSYEPITEFKHLVTGKATPIQNFRLGPVPRSYSQDGYTVMGFHPNPLPLEVIGDRVFLATQSIESSPGFANPEEPRYTNSFMTYSAALADMQNADLASAPVHAQLQNKTAWLPWMHMGDHPGGTIARGFGGKVAGLDALPPGALEGFEQHVPQILDTENWGGFVSEAISAEYPGCCAA